MKLVVTRNDCVKADRAARPAPCQLLKKQVYEAVNQPFIEDAVERDNFHNALDMSDAATLDALVMESDGKVSLLVTFSHSVELQLADLALPQDVQDRVVARMQRVRELNRAKRREKKSKKESR